MKSAQGCFATWARNGRSDHSFKAGEELRMTDQDERQRSIVDDEFAMCALECRHELAAPSTG